MNSKIRQFVLPLIVLTRPFRVLYYRWRADGAFRYHIKRFRLFSGFANPNTRESSRAFIMMNAHVLEKGLTMPCRRLGFGRDKVLQLIDLVDTFEAKFTGQDVLVCHAAGLILAYRKLHDDSGHSFSADAAFECALHDFCQRHSLIEPSVQPHVTRQVFYSDTECAFPAFAASRHTVRHYAGAVPFETIEKAVELAQTAPSACNRQHVRVHCVANANLRDSLLSLQKGSRGFGTDADKLLVITSDLSDSFWKAEHMDIYINAGIFIMNLSYALHYHKVGSCILNWSTDPSTDRIARALLELPQSETIVAMMTCGEVPDEFDYASSPRRPVGDILTTHL